MNDLKLMRLPVAVALLVTVGSCSDQPTGPDDPGIQPVGEAVADGGEVRPVQKRLPADRFKVPADQLHFQHRARIQKPGPRRA